MGTFPASAAFLGPGLGLFQFFGPLHEALGELIVPHLTVIRVLVIVLIPRPISKVTAAYGNMGLFLIQERIQRSEIPVYIAHNYDFIIIHPGQYIPCWCV